MNTSTNPPFYTFLREERQFSFLLAFFLMQKGDGLVRFIELVRSRMDNPDALPIPSSAQLDAAEVYVEYAYLRDYWKSLSFSDPTKGESTPLPLAAANREKRACIQHLFNRVESLKTLAEAPLPTEMAEFNAYFMGEAGRRITRDIASPGRWRTCWKSSKQIQRCSSICASSNGPSGSSRTS